MANYCKYSIRVKGKELACNAFWAMIPVLDWSEITDIETEDGETIVYGAPNDLYKIKEAISKKIPNIEFDMDEITMLPKEKVTLT